MRAMSCTLRERAGLIAGMARSYGLRGPRIGTGWP